MINRKLREGISHSVVELGGTRHVFASATPRQEGNLRAQCEDALRSIQAAFSDCGAGGSIIKQSIFIGDPRQIDQCREIVREFHGDNLPATTYIPQRPCSGKLLEIEAMGIASEDGQVDIERHSEQLVVSRHDGVAWLHSSHIAPSTKAPHVYERSTNAFEKLSGNLTGQQARFDQIVRTWLYLGDIVGPEGETQRYKELNRARTDFYEGMNFVADRLPDNVDWPVYPASTGIGTDGKDVLMSSIAVSTDRDDVVMVPLENPQQTSAFDYREHYSPRSPKFCRAMAVAVGDSATIFISGTASITDSETRFIDDAKGQTGQTLDNIESLISAENFQSHDMPQLGATLEDLAAVRVYVKRQEDYEGIKAICDQRLRGVPAIYTIADVCREDLLVEIEGVAFSYPKQRA
jgi:enamine deaminase RidA (YjgF/YER057c/UK114 family)